MKLTLSTLLTLFTTLSFCAEPYVSTLERSDLSATLECSDGALHLSLSRGESPVLAPSPLALLLDGEMAQWQITEQKRAERCEQLPMLYGEFSEVTTSFDQVDYLVTLTTKAKTILGTLCLRLYDGAVAYQLSLDDVGSSTRLHEVSSWLPSDLTGSCFTTNGEREPLGPQPISSVTRARPAPFIYQTDSYMLAIGECDLSAYPQLVVKGSEDGSRLWLGVAAVEHSGALKLPFRVVMVGESYAELHNQKPIYQTMAPAAQGDYSWVRPGLCMWDWRVRGCHFDGFTYGVDTKSLIRFVDFCAANGIEYFLVDADWYEKHDPLTPVAGLDIKRVLDHASSVGVGVFLYYDLKYTDDGHPEVPFAKVASTYASYGAKGIKYGFLTGKTSQKKSEKTLEIITTAAQNRLLVDFHDNPIPFSGLERTHPNYITREYCHAQLDRRTAFTAGQFVKMACINLLAGHMDQTNGTFALDEMKSRSKGPRNQYNSTVAAEVARFFITHTGALSMLIDAPEAYAAKGDLFQFITSMPSSWEKTLYLDMDYTSHVAVAKASASKWFAGVVFGDNGGHYSMKLDFLEPGVRYRATIFRDGDTAHHTTNREAYTIESREVRCTDAIELTVPCSGGFSVIFEKI